MNRIALLLLPLVAWATTPPAEVAPAPPAEVRRSLGGGVTVDWTKLRVELASRSDDPKRARDPRPLEQEALDVIEARLSGAVGRVPVSPAGTLDGLGLTDHPGAGRWRVVETRYHTGGAVEVIGAVELQDLLGGWATARAVPPPPPSTSTATGAVIDARGLGVAPCWAPELRTPSGELVFDAVTWKDVAWQTAPVVWVADPMHPGAARAAGATPEFFVAVGAEGCVIGLADEDAARWRERVAPTRAAGAGGVVVVVEP